MQKKDFRKEDVLPNTWGFSHDNSYDIDHHLPGFLELLLMIACALGAAFLVLLAAHGQFYAAASSQYFLLSPEQGQACFYTHNS